MTRRPAPTVGVEEEFHLVDPVSGETRPGAASVLARAGDRPAGAFHSELLLSQVEAVTGVCSDLGTLRGQIEEGRRRLDAAARDEGLRLSASGTPVRPGPAPEITPGERFALITATHAGTVRDYETCGCHVHVGVPDREAGVAVVNHLRPWLPMLVALAANSPFHRGRDTGYASWRIIEQARFPGAGTPPWTASAADYDARLDRLVDCGVLADPGMTFWLARPSPRFPTVEVRAADSVGTPGEAVLQAALTRALVRTALDDLAAGREAGKADDQFCAAALWSAARYGLDGPAIDPEGRGTYTAARRVRALVDHVRPALEEAGDLDTVRTAVAWLERAGTGTARQRRAAATGPGAVIAMLIEQTTEPRCPTP
ncbi:carboxylate-amine ligase [Spirillospora sp. CA-294931]|uniref:carboxylate-amine ligase n=1 Tax=Spirillospora sp. CA-294931 TaxID=3240042 RepID=UPI003D8A9D12